MLLTESIELDEDVLQFAFEVAGQRVECLTNFVQHGEELLLFKLHLGGNARNQIGRAALWEIAREIGRYFGAKTLRIEGGRRSTGRLIGRVPTPIVISVF
jgi:hypothetical protein